MDRRGQRVMMAKIKPLFKVFHIQTNGTVFMRA